MCASTSSPVGAWAAGRAERKPPVTTPDAGPSFEAFAQFGAALTTDMRAVRRELADQRARDLAARPVHQGLPQAGTVPASGPLTLDLGTPQMGRAWSVRRLSVSDSSSAIATVAGAATWYVGPAAIPAPGNVAWRLATLPAVERFTGDTLRIKAGEHLICVITGGTAAQGIIARADIADYPADAGVSVSEV